SPRLYLVDGPLAVMDFLPGGALRSESFADNAVAEAAADLLRRLHGLGSSLPGPVRFNYPFQKVRRYYAFLKDAGTGKATAAVPEFESLCAGIEAQVPPFIPTFVHMDLLPQNFVYDADGALKLIDWDHGGIGHPLADLASMTVNGDILRPRWQALLSRYLGRTAHREDMKLFSLFCVVVSLMEYLWAPVQELVSHLPGDAVTASMASTYGAYAPTYEGYSELNLDRFRTVLDEHRRIFGPIEAAA
ncbi:MAG: phosphotransferase family protein, partial [Parvibaculaceae bacterium]